MEKKIIKKALVVSGGGSMGSFSGGIIQGLTKDLNKNYDLYVATSTGSLLSPLSSIGDFDRLYKAYTTVTQESIFDVNPFTKKGTINIINAIARITTGKKTLGESNTLRKRIGQFFTEEDFKNILASGKEVVATTVNTTQSQVEYKTSADPKMTYNDMCDWIWASACAPVFMTLVEKNGCQYVDGGIMQHVPIQYAIDRGAEEIDVVISRTKDYDHTQKPPITNVLDLFEKVVDIMLQQLSTTSLEAKDKDVKVNIYYLPYTLTTNSLMFNEEEMKKWWAMGRTMVDKFETKIIKKK